MSGGILLVSFNASPALEEVLVDWLLEFDAEQRFASYTVNEHNTDHSQLSLAEQVTGRQKQIRFEMIIAEDRYAGFMDKFKTDFSGSGINYRVVRALSQGCF